MIIVPIDQTFTLWGINYFPPVGSIHVVTGFFSGTSGAMQDIQLLSDIRQKREEEKRTNSSLPWLPVSRQSFSLCEPSQSQLNHGPGKCSSLNMYFDVEQRRVRNESLSQ